MDSELKDKLAEIVSPTAPTTVEAVEVTEDGCPNCANHGKTNKLDASGNCSECGYEKGIQ